MKLEPGEFEVVCLDRQGFDLARFAVGSFKEAKRRAKLLLRDPEYSGECGKSEVLNAKGECIVDYFAD